MEKYFGKIKSEDLIIELGKEKKGGRRKMSVVYTRAGGETNLIKFPDSL